MDTRLEIEGMSAQIIRNVVVLYAYDPAAGPRILQVLTYGPVTHPARFRVFVYDTTNKRIIVESRLSTNFYDAYHSLMVTVAGLMGGLIDRGGLIEPNEIGVAYDGAWWDLNYLQNGRNQGE